MENYEKEHLQVVLDNGAECTVLLKSNGEFPLKNPCKLAAYGSGMRYTIKGGTGSGEVNSRFTYTIEEGLEKAGFSISSKKWLDQYDIARAEAKKQFYKELKAEAKEKHENPIIYTMGKEMREANHSIILDGEGDAAIYVVSRNSGEGSDRNVVEGDVLLTKSEIRDILALNKKFKKFMLVLNVGGVVDLSPVMEIGNILLLSQLGVDCGHILADILLGKQNPSGKLTTTWAAADCYSKEGSFGDWNDNRYTEGIYVGYRYFDTFGKKALFPFGYGLSYTEFSITTKSVAIEKDHIKVGVSVTNKGIVAGKEVVQVYLSMPEVKLDKPYQDLVAYRKTSLLQPGQTEEINLEFNLSDFASYDEARSSYVLESGDYMVRVGNSSISTEVAAVVSLDHEAVTLKCRNCLGKPDFSDVKAPNREVEEIPSNALHLNMNASDIKMQTVNYDVKYQVEDIVRSLTDEELAFLQIGNFNPNAKGLSIIGNAATHLAGAAGETTSQLAEKGIKPLIMADGPAGIRVALKYYEDETGAHDANNNGMIPQSMLEMMGPISRFIAKKIAGGQKTPKHAVIKEHAATMIPIGSAIAQSFNIELAEAFGDIIGDEMERMGVNLWLAPALNIHRSILCGRNFEYYSEDPFVSGMVAAAVTKGVQKHKGCSVTIKHYAANNAETNRYCNNSQVSERAMREVYLRGFGICVKEAGPRSVMTSYNLLNGTHTAEHRGLIEDILRNQFGFDGIVMTDWVIDVMTSEKSKYRNSLSHEVAKAGGDLFMPGGKKDYENVLKALKDGRLSREQVEINASRVVRLSQQLR